MTVKWKKSQQNWLNSFFILLKRDIKCPKKSAFNSEKYKNINVSALALCQSLKKIHRAIKRLKKKKNHSRAPLQSCINHTALYPISCHLTHGHSLCSYKLPLKQSHQKRVQILNTFWEVPSCGRCQTCNMFLICLEVVSSFKCFVVYLQSNTTKTHTYENISHVHVFQKYDAEVCEVTDLSALRRPSTLLEGWSRRTLMHPFICKTQRDSQAVIRWWTCVTCTPCVKRRSFLHTHIDFRRLHKSSGRMNVVVEDDDSHHHTQAE